MTAKVEQVDKDCTAAILGYKTWEDATDYRNTGEQVRKVAHVLNLVAKHRLASAALKAERAG